MSKPIMSLVAYGKIDLDKIFYVTTTSYTEKLIMDNYTYELVTYTVRCPEIRKFLQFN